MPISIHLKRKDRDADLFTRRRREFLPWLQLFNIQGGWPCLPEKCRRDLLAARQPTPELLFDPSIPENLQPAIRSAVLDDWKKAAISFGERKMPLLEVITHLVPLSKWFIELFDPIATSPETKNLCNLFRDTPPFAAAVIADLQRRLMIQLYRFSSIDHRLFHVRPQTTSVGAKTQYGWRLQAIGAKSKSFILGGEPRDAWRLGQNTLGPAWPWASIKLDLLKPHVKKPSFEPDSDSSLIAPDSVPVYIQKHALEQIIQRLFEPLPPQGRSDEDRKNIGYIREAIVESLKSPKIVPYHGDLLIEYHIRGHHLGYLVAQPLPDALVLRTFLLLTMGGTPTGDKLRGLLRLKGAEMHWLKLDDFITVSRSDVRLDLHLRSLFEKAGCHPILDFGQLLEEPPTIPLAGEISKFIKAHQPDHELFSNAA